MKKIEIILLEDGSVIFKKANISNFEILGILDFIKKDVYGQMQKQAEQNRINQLKGN